MDIKEHKKTFQLERLILFSDAVFAIAITLLVIELKLPDMPNPTEASVANALVGIMPHFISFFISFMIIGIYWQAHHRMFYYVIHYDQRLIWLNLLFLFFIALMPFTSNVYGVYIMVKVAFALYVFNIFMLALFMFLMYRYISLPGKNLSHGLDDKRLVRYYQARSLVAPVCFGIGVLIAFSSDAPWAYKLSRLSPALIAPAIGYLRRRYAPALS